jgi:ATP-dependent helicase/nuclease subunit B
MSKVILISPRQNLIEIVADHLSGEQRDYSKTLVVFPGRRPAHFLSKMLAERGKSSYYPPHTFSIDDLVEFLLSNQLGVRRMDLGAVDAIAILYDIHTKLKTDENNRRGLGDSFVSLDTFYPIGVKLFGELEEVALADLHDREVREKLQSVQYPKFHSLWHYYKEFYAEAERRHRLTRSMRYRMLADAVGKSPSGSPTTHWDIFDRIIVAGFYALTNVERRIMGNLLALDHVLFITHDGIGLQNQLRKLGIDDGTISRGEDDPGGEPTIHFYKAPDTHGQISGLAAKLKQQQERDGAIDEKTVVVLPSSESLFPVIHGALPVLPAEEYNISLGYPLTRTPLYGFLSSLMELIESSFNGKFSPAAYIQFILHPYTKSIRFRGRSDVTRMMLHKVEEHLGGGELGGMFTLDELEADGEVCSSICNILAGIDVRASADEVRAHLTAIHTNIIRRFQAIQSIRDLTLKTTEILTYVYEQSTARLHPLLQPYAERCIELLDSIGSSLIAEHSFNDLSSYFLFLRHALADISVPFPGTPLRGMQVLGLLETRNIQFDTVYILDANDDVLPGKPGGDMLLPQTIRRMLGLETYQEKDRLKEYYLDVAIRGAKNVHLFYTETPEGQKEKSRFVEKLLWRYQKKAQLTSSEKFVADIGYNATLSHRRPSATPKTNEIVEFLRTRNSFSASQLDTYLTCQLKFYYKTVLGLRETTEVDDDVDQLEVGSLVHTILKKLFTPTLHRRLSVDDLADDRIQSIVDGCFEDHFGGDLVGPAYFLKQQVMVQLRKFVSDYQIPRVKSEEIIIDAVEAEVRLAKDRLSFYGKIDRVERRGGRVVIMDYKTGKDDSYAKIRMDKLDPDNRDTWSEAIGSLQLPMYTMLYCGSSETSPEEVDAVYLFLGRNHLDEESEVALEAKGISSTEIYRLMEGIIMKIVEEIIDVKKDFAPTAYPEEDCADCPYNVVCGTQWTRRPGES